MIKTSVYLSEDEAAALRRLATTSGQSQADLIREGVRRVTGDEPARHFKSRASGSGPAYSPPTAEEIEAHINGIR